MTLAPYRQLLSQRAVLRLLLVGVVARIPHTAAGIVLTLHVVQSLDRGYGAAGLVAAASTVGVALGAPWRGRAVDRLGLRRALLPSVLGEAVIWSVAPFLPYRALLVAAVVGGLLSLPVFTVVRQSLSILVTEDRRRTAYAVDSIGVELSFMVGPAVGVVVATTVSTTAALLLVGATTVVAGVGLMWFDPPTRSDQLRPVSAALGRIRASDAAGTAAEAAEAAARDGVSVAGSRAGPEGAQDAPAARPTWRSPALLAVLGAAAGATLVLAGTEVTVVAVLREADAVRLTGVVFACWGAGSIVGALVYGALPRGVHPLWLLLGLSVLTVPVGVAHEPLLLALLLVPAGALCAPVISSTAEAVARLVPESSRGVAMGWHGSSLTVGIALGAPAAGSVIDRVGPWGGSTLVAGVGIVLAVAGLLAHRAHETDATRTARGRVDADPPVVLREDDRELTPPSR